MKRIDTYKLPMGITVALKTNRPELIGVGLRTNGGTFNFTGEEQHELVRLLADLLNDRVEVERRVEELRQAVKMTAQTSRGQLDKLETLMEAVCRGPGMSTQSFQERIAVILDGPENSVGQFTKRDAADLMSLAMAFGWANMPSIDTLVREVNARNAGAEALRGQIVALTEERNRLRAELQALKPE